MGRPKLTEEQRKISEARRREKQKEYIKRWQQKNKKHISEYQKKWRRENPEKYNAAMLRHFQKITNSTITEVK